MHVARNAFGRQVDSCEVFLDVGRLARPDPGRDRGGQERPAYGVCLPPGARRWLAPAPDVLRAPRG